MAAPQLQFNVSDKMSSVRVSARTPRERGPPPPLNQGLLRTFSFRSNVPVAPGAHDGAPLLNLSDAHRRFSDGVQAFDGLR